VSVTKRELEAVRENARAATTQDLLDRVTVYREGMDPDAVKVIEEELAGRGVRTAEIEAHEQNSAEVLRDENGVALTCSLCNRPAVAVDRDMLATWGGFLMLGSTVHGWRLYCSDHAPQHPTEPLV
jgi:hypothetical protein